MHHLQKVDITTCYVGNLEHTRSELRWRIVHIHKADPSLKPRQIAKKLAVSHNTVSLWLSVYKKTGNVLDQHRSGRKAIISEAALSKISKRAIQKHAGKVFSSTELAGLLEHELGVSASPRTVRRSFRAAGWRYGSPKQVLMLHARHREKRLAFAKQHLSKKTSFSSWLFTDSKLFLLHKTSAKAAAKIWYPQGGRPTLSVVKQSQGVHVYLGVSKYGVTRAIFVTGGGSQKSMHVNPKTGQPYHGVSAAEYQEQVLPLLIKDGDHIFKTSTRWGSEWLFQQDNARAHIAKTTKAVLDDLLPHRVVHEWPAMSPDLSWIENIWAWAESQLNRHYRDIHSLDDLKSALTEVLKCIPKKMLENYVRSMPKRLQAVVEQNGGPIA